MHHQAYTYGMNHWEVEPDLKAILARYWTDYKRVEEDLHAYCHQSNSLCNLQICTRSTALVGGFAVRWCLGSNMDDRDSGRK